MEIGPNIAVPSPTFCRDAPTSLKDTSNSHIQNSKVNQVGTVVLYGVPIVSLLIDAQERLCLAQISNTLLKNFSYNEIHNRRVALGITCVQCTPVQLEILRRAGAMPVSSRRCGMITRREAERLCKSFLGDNAPPRLPEDFAFSVHHECAWGCRGVFLPGRYNSSRAKCIKCSTCGLFFSPNKFIFHSHRIGPNPKYVQPDAANFNSWRRHMKLSGSPPDEIVYAWEDVKAMFNGGTRKRLVSASSPSNTSISVSKSRESSPPTFQLPAPPPRVPTLPMVMDYVWHHGSLKNPFVPYSPDQLAVPGHGCRGVPPVRPPERLQPSLPPQLQRRRRSQVLPVGFPPRPRLRGPDPRSALPPPPPAAPRLPRHPQRRGHARGRDYGRYRDLP
ncbi:unnamed protein product [Bemisia tabaci]|uniref:c-SKI SMAD4-binding domain-containing protein n=1 Tax=Bemisia tabaci TaxID=7038 RepID=A0A9P0EZ60_BEMTA|nr:unnamed protein product [Bemisia tabaci]